MIVIDNKFDFRQHVFLKTDPDQLPRIVVSMQVCPNGDILYRLCCGPAESWHYEFEISDGKDVLIKSFD
jgi:hypothetical protein